MKKFVSLVLVLVLVVFALTSCSVESAEAGSRKPFEGRFETYYAGDLMTVIVDRGTGVCYLWHSGGSGRGGLTVMFDEDGRPLTYWEDGYEE